MLINNESYRTIWFDKKKEEVNIIDQTKLPFYLEIVTLNNLEDVIFSRLTGSGSCIFSVFQNKTEAEKAQIQFKRDFPKLWSHLAENNKLNLF